MANNNLEAYLEAIQAAVEGGDIPPVPAPSWNHEQYLAAILAALVNGGGGSGGSGVYLVNYALENSKGAEKSGDEKGPVTPKYNCDKTAGEIWTALEDGSVIIFHRNETGYEDYLPLVSATFEDGYGYYFSTYSNTVSGFSADTAEDYPHT